MAEVDGVKVFEEVLEAQPEAAVMKGLAVQLSPVVWRL
jgi:hypothetical protein